MPMFNGQFNIRDKQAQSRKNLFGFLTQACLLCNTAPRQTSQPLCLSCWNNMPWLHDAFYIQQHKFQAACHYQWPVDRLIHLYKYQGRLDVLPVLSSVLQHCPRPQVQALVPVPLSPQRLKLRGFNPSLLLARHLSRYWQIPLWQPLKRHEGIAQRHLSRLERLGNLHNAFYPDPSHCRVIPRQICVIDDVITTGSTFIAMHASLQTLGVQQIDCLALAKAHDKES